MRPGSLAAVVALGLMASTLWGLKLINHFLRYGEVPRWS